MLHMLLLCSIIVQIFRQRNQITKKECFKLTTAPQYVFRVATAPPLPFIVEGCFNSPASPERMGEAMHRDAREKRQMNPLLLYISQKSRIFAAAFGEVWSCASV